MTERNTFLRSMHDVGLAAWFGGTLMGAIGVNGAAEEAGSSPTDTARIASVGWAKWTPVNAAAITAHLIGATGLLTANKARLPYQRGLMASTAAKTALTGLALAATAYSRVLGKKVELSTSPDPDQADMSTSHPVPLAQAQRQLRLAQWAVPASTAALLILNALHGEQQRPAEQLRGMVNKAVSRLNIHH
ncbi:hypothetical protein [Streptomyces sp. G7(2002)]|uniref:hypothetical protein n=1 Tax=Streptomyces sp. G7(2002) TaxID=2971798 RepID=UPI00237D9751|nr:hypothetical protein [Streptomyces sp. G7(2002)]WDT58495.1 hypothetical protein NUT86_33180 [Streptomyces sp. G7(2002)]